MKTTRSTKKILLVIVFILLTFCGITQEGKQSSIFKNWSVNINGGANLFQGDIEVYTWYPVMDYNNEWRMAYGLMIQKELGSSVTMRGQWLTGQLSGTKRKFNRWFEADIFETSLNFTLNLNNFFGGVKDRDLFFYAMAGVGISQWRTELKDLQTNEVISTNGFSKGSGLGGRTMEGVVPFGAGADWRLNDRLSLILETTFRPVNSDFLDANKGDFPYDIYNYNFIGLTYRFTRKETEKPIIYPVEDEPLIVIEQVEEPFIEEPYDEEAARLRELEKELLETESKSKPGESPWSGIVFRVQIMASHDAIEPASVKNRYNLNEEVIVTQGDNWYRYSVGNFNKYWKAKEYKNILLSKYGVPDAFVVAYKNDDRLLLPEVLQHLPEEPVGESAPVETETGVFYRVQVMASINEVSTQALQAQYNIESGIFIEKSGTYNRYTTGMVRTLQEAEQLKNELVGKGIKDAFIVAYRNGKRISLKEADK